MNTKLILQIIIIAVILIAFVLWLIWQLKKKGLNEFAIEMIVKAEKQFNYGENQEKINYVIDKVIAIIPMPLSLFITREFIKKFVQSIFDKIKVALDYKEE